MRRTVADYLVERLGAWGRRARLRLPGRRRQRVHERALVGQQPRTALGTRTHQEIDLGSLLKDVAHEYVQTAMHPAQAAHLVDRAARIALAERTVTCLIVPDDLQECEFDEAATKRRPSSDLTIPRVVTAEHDLQRAAELLNAGRRPAMLVGQGALDATDQVIAVVERISAGVHKALLGKAALPDHLPWVTGSIGMLGTRASWQLMQSCDTLLIVGSNLPYPEFLPDPDRARGVQSISTDGSWACGSRPR